MITIDWLLLAMMLSGTASLSALLGILWGISVQKRFGRGAEGKTDEKTGRALTTGMTGLPVKNGMPKGSYRLMCEKCQHSRFDMPDHTSVPCQRCEKQAGGGFEEKSKTASQKERRAT